MSFDRKATMRAVLGTCRYAGIHDGDRMVLASAILDRPGITSFTELDDEELAIMYWALEHWKLIQKSRLLNGTMLVEARILIEEDERDTAEVRAKLGPDAVLKKDLEAQNQDRPQAEEEA